MSKRTTYTITASRSDEWWALTVAGIGLKRSYHTQVKRLEQAEEMARDLVATILDMEPAEIEADFDLIMDDDQVATELEATLLTRLVATCVKWRAAEATRATVADLARRGYVHRDIGYLLGISHQAVSKLLSEAGQDAPAAAGEVATRWQESAIQQSRCDRLSVTHDTEALLHSYLLDVPANGSTEFELDRLRILGARLREGKRRRPADA